MWRMWLLGGCVTGGCQLEARSRRRALRNGFWLRQKQTTLVLVQPCKAGGGSLCGSGCNLSHGGQLIIFFHLFFWFEPIPLQAQGH